MAGEGMERRGERKRVRKGGRGVRLGKKRRIERGGRDSKKEGGGMKEVEPEGPLKICYICYHLETHYSMCYVLTISCQPTSFVILAILHIWVLIFRLTAPSCCSPCQNFLLKRK